MRSSNLASFLLCALLLTAAGCGKAPEPPDGGEPDAGEPDAGGDAGLPDAGEFVPTTNAEHNAMLEGLGFETQLGARLDPLGEPVSDAYHPLGKRFSVFHPRAELYLGGITFADKREHLFDDSSQGYARLAFTAKQDTSWAGATMKNGVAGDFDGDGLEEVFIAYFVEATKRLRFIVYDLDGEALKEGELDPATTATAALDVMLQPSLAAGDLDGDGRDEVAVGFSRFYLVDELEHDPVVTTKTHDGQDVNDAFVAMGNLDWDGAEELVVSYTTTSGQTIGRYAIYDGHFATPTQAGPLTLTDPQNAAHTAREAQVAIGDVDGDRLGEIVFGGLVESNLWALFILEYGRPTDSPLYDWKSFFYRPGWASASIPRPLLLLDWDGDSRKEIFYNALLLRVTRDPAPQQVNIGLSSLSRAAVGDLDGDGRDDLVFEWYSTVRTWGLNSLDQPADKHTWSGTVTPWSSVVLVPTNMDGDSPIVRYDGDHELLFTAPHLVAVLASPPYRAGIGQNVEATASTFGKSSGQTVEKEASLGFSTGFSVGYEADFGIFGGAEFTATVEQSLDFIAGESVTVEKYHSYTTGPGEDKVVFTTVPFDVYYYVITASPAPEDVGRTVTINVPREPQTLATTRGFYNSHNGGGLDVGAEVLQHTPGDVWSYPTLAERDRVLAAAEAREPGYQRLWNGPMVVGEGGGFETIGISTSQGSSRGAAMDFSVKLEFSTTSPGGAKFGSSVGFHLGYSCTYSTEDTAFFEGSVGNIPAAQYTAENRYQFGLFVYPQSTGGQKFLVMNYWTEP